MLKKSMFLLFFLPITALADEFEFSLGTGFQYSGLLGTQFALKNQNSKYFVSLGIPGYSLGLQKIVSDNEYHSAGFSVGKIQRVLSGASKFAFATYNYHLNGFNEGGWVLGTGIGLYDEEPYTRIFSDERINPSRKVMLTFDIGYKF